MEHPAAESPGRKRRTQSAENAADRRIRVIVVDDHAMFREMLAAHLDGEGGIEVVGVAGSGSEALRLVSEQRPDVLLLDLLLPDMSGIEVARQVHSLYSDVSMLALTGYGEVGHLRAALGVGVRGYLQKTASIDELVAAIQTVAARRSLLIPEAARSEMLGIADALTAREREVLRQLAAGRRNAEIARDLVVSVKTIEFHIGHILEKLGARSRTEAILKARELGLLPFTESGASAS